jgi:hypothetical protein
MAREEHSGSLLGATAQHRGHRLGGEGIETREGLVKHEQLGVVHEGNRQLHPLLIAV